MVLTYWVQNIQFQAVVIINESSYVRVFNVLRNNLKLIRN